MWTQRLRGDRGASGSFMLIVLASLIVVIGLVSEVGQILALKREAERVAFESSRAGAVEVSLNSLYRGDHPYLDTTAASAEATSWANAEGFTDVNVSFHGSSGEYTNPSGDDQLRIIEVQLSKQHNFGWSIFGTTATIEASARSVAADGAAAAGQG